VFFVGLINLVEFMVLEAWVILHFLGEVSSSPHPCSSNFQIGFLTVYTMDTECPLSEVWVSSLKESLHGVVGLDEKLSFVGILFIENFPSKYKDVYTRLTILDRRSFARTIQTQLS